MTNSFNSLNERTTESPNIQKNIEARNSISASMADTQKAVTNVNHDAFRGMGAI